MGAVAAGWYASARNGISVDKNGKLIPAHASAADPFLLVMYGFMFIGFYITVAEWKRWNLGVPGIEIGVGRYPAYDARLNQSFMKDEVAFFVSMSSRLRSTWKVNSGDHSTEDAAWMWRVTDDGSYRIAQPADRSRQDRSVSS